MDFSKSLQRKIPLAKYDLALARLRAETANRLTQYPMLFMNIIKTTYFHSDQAIATETYSGLSQANQVIDGMASVGERAFGSQYQVIRVYYAFLSRRVAM